MHPLNSPDENHSEAIASLKNQGVGVVRGLLDPLEVAELIQECARLWDDRVTPLSPYNLRVSLRKDENGKDVLERLDPVADISPAFQALNQDARIVSLARRAFGEEVQVLKEKLIYKWPGTGGYGPHRDENYFGSSGVPGPDLLSISIALEPANAENGTVMFYPALRNTPLPAPADEPRDIDGSALEGKPFTMPELAAGDAVLFDGLIPHCSGRNLSQASRKTYNVTFVPARYEGCRDAYYRHRLEEQSQFRGESYAGRFFLA